MLPNLGPTSQVHRQPCFDPLANISISPPQLRPYSRSSHIRFREKAKSFASDQICFLDPPKPGPREHKPLPWDRATTRPSGRRNRATCEIRSHREAGCEPSGAGCTYQSLGTRCSATCCQSLQSTCRRRGRRRRRTVLLDRGRRSGFGV